MLGLVASKRCCLESGRPVQMPAAASYPVPPAARETIATHPPTYSLMVFHPPDFRPHMQCMPTPLLGSPGQSACSFSMGRACCRHQICSLKTFIDLESPAQQSKCSYLYLHMSKACIWVGGVKGICIPFIALLCFIYLLIFLIQLIYCIYL